VRFTGPFFFANIFVGLVLLLPPAVHGQTARVLLKGPRPLGDTGSLSISVTPSQVHFNLVAHGTANSNCPVNITTTWSGATLGSVVSLYGSFASSSAAMSGTVGSAVLPSSVISGQMTTGLPTTYTPFSQTNPLGAAGASLKLFSQTVSGSDSGNRTDALSLSINLSTLPRLPADTYTGTLIIQAQEL